MFWYTCILDQSLTDILTTFEPENTGNTGKMFSQNMKIQDRKCKNTGKKIKKQIRTLFLQHVSP